MSGWRKWALIAGALTALAGIAVWRLAGPMVLILGLLMLITAALEPIYGRPDGIPRGRKWQRTPERFVDPETGALVSVWFDSATGERRYVEDPGGPRPT